MKTFNRFLLTVSLICITATSFGQEAQKSFFGWNKTLGIGVGYTNVYKGFNSQHEGIAAPKDLIHFDLTVYGIYAGIDFMVKDTGYDVLGYSEKLDTWALKFGPSFRVGNANKWRCVLTPYIGFMSYSLFDSSGNAIGARDDYGTKETQFLVGGRLSAVYDWYYLGFHYSNRELGVSIGIEFNL